MKVHSIVLCTLFTSIAAHAADTAYTALRAVGKKDRSTLNHVLEVRGRNGSPQPDVWKITIEEAQARGGLREFDVQRGRIIAQRTPTGRSYGGVMNFGQLNLDSDGVFTIINQETQQQGVTFDRLEYALRAGTGGGAPVWQVDLFDASRRAGRMVIAADSGAVLDREFAPTAPEPPPTTRRGSGNGDRYSDRSPAVSDRELVERDPGSDIPPPSSGRWSQPGEKFRSVEDFFHRLGRRFERRGDQLKRFFTSDEPR